MRVFNTAAAFTAVSTVDLTYDLTLDSASAAHAAGAVVGTVEATGGVACTLSSPLCILPGTTYVWCDTVLASLGPIQGAGNANSGDLLLTFGADVTSILINARGLDVVEIWSLDSADALTEDVYHYTVTEKLNSYIGIVPLLTTTRALRLLSKRNVEWCIDALSAEAT